MLIGVTRAGVLAGISILAGCSDVDRAYQTVTSSVHAAFFEPPRHTTQPRAPTPSPASSSWQFDDVATAKPPAPHDSKPVAVNGLSGKEVRALLGQPTTRSGPAPGETWTYKSGPCQVDLYLFPDVSHGGLHVLDYRVNGASAHEESKQACLRRLGNAPSS